MLWRAGVWVDFVEISQVSAEQLIKYKAVIFPFPLAVGREVFNVLKKYVSLGGVLISEACIGRYDKFGFTYPGELIEGVEELFGVEHDSLQLCHEPIKPPKWTPRERSYGEIRPPTRFDGCGVFKGHSLLASLYVETFRCNTAKPILLCDGKVAGAVNEYGKGKAYIIGTLLGHAYAAFKDERTRGFILDLLEKEGVHPDVYGRLPVRKRIYKDYEAQFLINMTSKPVVETIEVGIFSEIEDLIEGSIKARSGKLRIKVEPLSIKCLIFKY